MRESMEISSPFWYDPKMAEDNKTPESNQPDSDQALMRRRLQEAMNLQRIEGNPLTADDVAMLQMFIREGWSSERRTAYINEYLKSLASAPKK
jgi:hypothetical protein